MPAPLPATLDVDIKPTNKMPLVGTGLRLAIGLGLLVAIVGVAVRPPLPIDETRYLSVAWEMQTSGDYLVPHKNGAIYSHKPPLLFWLINLAWALTGGAEWAGRLVGPLAGITSLWLTSALSRRLWPGRSLTGELAPLILASMLLWALFTSLTMFDALLTVGVLLVAHGAVRLQTPEQLRGIWLIGAGIGIGILAKGPVILVHTLPMLFFAPWWRVTDTTNSTVKSACSISLKEGEPQQNLYRGWYRLVLLSLMLGIGIAMCWVIPAIIAGGAEYRNAILWKQTAGRMVHSFSHQQPWWYYTAFLPVIVMPWVFHGTLLRSLRSVRLDSGVRMLLIWAGGSLLILSIISGKQAYYLTPVIPAISLLFARLLCETTSSTRRDVFWISISTIAMGIAILVHPLLPIPVAVQGLLAPWIGLPSIAWGLWMLSRKERTVFSTVCWISTAGVVNLALFQIGIAGYFDQTDIRPIAREIHRLQEADIPVAIYGDYHDQFHYLGRLRQPLDVIHEEKMLTAWIQQHPQGRLIRIDRVGKNSDETPRQEQIEFSQSMLRGLSPRRLTIVRPENVYSPQSLAPRTANAISAKTTR